MEQGKKIVISKTRPDGTSTKVNFQGLERDEGNYVKSD